MALGLSEQLARTRRRHALPWTGLVRAEEKASPQAARAAALYGSQAGRRWGYRAEGVAMEGRTAANAEFQRQLLRALERY